MSSNSPVPSNHGDTASREDDETSSLSTEQSTNQEICIIIFYGLQKTLQENQPIPDIKEILDEELKDLQTLRTKYNENSINAELDGTVNLGEREQFTNNFEIQF